MAALDQLIEQAKKTAGSFGGLLSLLLAVKRGATKNIEFRGAAFYVEGDRVTPALIQKELGRVELKIAATIFSYNEKLFKKEWTIVEWREAMEKLVEDSHILFAALAMGGIATAVKDVDVKRRIERDKKAVKRFSRALRYKQVPTLQLAHNRGRSYLRSFYVTFQLLNHAINIFSGKLEAKNILSPAEHCRTPKTQENSDKPEEGCYEIAVKGWLPIKQMPPIGTRVCGQFCKCHLIYR